MVKCDKCGLFLDPGENKDIICPRCEERFIRDRETSAREVKPFDFCTDREIEIIYKECNSKSWLYFFIGSTLSLLLLILTLIFYKINVLILFIFICMIFASGIGGSCIPQGHYARLLHEKGINLYKQGNYEEAIKYYDSSLKLNIEPYVLLDKGMALLKLKRYEEAVEFYTDASVSLPFSIEAKTYLEYAKELRDKNK